MGAGVAGDGLGFPDRRTAFARRMESRLRISVRPVAGAREAVEGADVVVTATTARDPVWASGFRRAST